MPGKESSVYFYWIDENTVLEKESVVKRDRCNSIMNESLAEALISRIGGVLSPLRQTDSLKGRVLAAGRRGM